VRGARPRLAWAALGLLLVLGALSPLLWSDRTGVFRDCLVYSAPVNSIVRGALLEGRLPEWDSTQFTGVPFLANPSSQALYPLRWVAALSTSHPGKANEVFALLHLLLALAGGVALGRELGLRPGPRKALAVTYLLGGPLLSLLTNPVYLVGACWLPLSLAWILRARRKLPSGGAPALRAAALAPLGLALPLYGGDPQTPGWLALLAIVVCLAPRGEQEAPFGRRALLLSGVGLATVALAAMILLPALALTPETTRASGLSYNEIGLWSFHPARVGELLVPLPLGTPFPQRGAYLGGLVDHRLPDLWSHTLFLGAGAALLVVRALGPVPAPLRRAKTALVGLALISLALACGRYTPIHETLCELTPYSLFRFPEKHLTLMSLALAGLAGIGLQAWLDAAPWRAPRRLLPFLGVPLLTLLVGWALSGWAGTLLSQAAPTEIGVAGQAARSAPPIAPQVASTILVQVALLALLAFPGLSRRRKALAVVALLALTTLSVNHRLIFAGPAQILDGPPDTVKWLRTQPKLGGRLPPRVQRWPRDKPFGRFPATSGLRAGEASAVLDAHTLRGASGALYGLDGVYGMTGFNPRRLATLLESTSPRTNGLARASVGYLVAPLEGRRDRARRALAGVGNDTAVFAFQGRPRLELLEGLHWVPNETEAWAALASVDSRSVVATGPGAATGSPARALGAARVLSPPDEPREVLRLTCEAPRPAVLVVRDAWWPGWSASLDGAPAELLRIDGVFMGVRVPEGSHEVELRYETPGLRGGALISLPTFAALLLLLAWRRRSPS
jgi:membrane protein YfhO